MIDPVARIQALQRVSIALADHIRALVEASDDVANVSERAEAFRLQALISARLEGLLFAVVQGAEAVAPDDANIDEAIQEAEARIQHIRRDADLAGLTGLTGQQISQDFFKEVELVLTVLGPEHVLPPLPPLPQSLGS